MRSLRRLALFAAATVIVAGTLVQTVAAGTNPPFIPASADWLTSVNYYREMAGLAPVVEDAGYSSGAYNHSCYMTYNGISHDEVAGAPGYTTSGDQAGNNGNVAVSTATGVANRSFIELWMTGPFHAIGVLRPQLQRVGYGQCENASAAKWRSGATLDVLRGLGPRQPLAAPVLFPGDGTVTSLNRFIAESPNPVQLCGWTGDAGLPVIGLMPEDFASNPTATMYGPSGPVQTCVLSRHNTSGTAQSILGGDNAVTIVPRTILTAGVYSVSLVTSSRTVNWSFTVDPSAADGKFVPPSAVPTAAPAGWQPVTPTRFVDSRVSLGATRLLAGTQKRIKLTGRQGLPDGATAVTANVTVTGAAGGGYLTVWNCSSPIPNASTVNFGADEAVPNAAVMPLDSDGSVCVYSPVAADIIIDVNGFFSPSSPSRLKPVTPYRVLDTRIGLGGGRLAAGQTVELLLPAAPIGATGALLNVTSVLPSSRLGWLTVYPCGPLPPTSSVNPVLGQVRPNTVITSVSPSRSVCVYASEPVDVVIDVFGYMVPDGSTGFTTSAPFRWVDTRSGISTEMNLGTNGSRVGSGQVITLNVAGQRSVPSTATSVTFNLTATDSTADGYLTAYPCGSMPPTSNVNFGAGRTVANGGTVALSPSGTLCVYSSSPVHVILDVVGWSG